MEKEHIAVVVKNAGSHYLLSELPAWELFPAVLRGKIRLKASAITNPVAVGDRVRYEPAATGKTAVTGQAAATGKAAGAGTDAASQKAGAKGAPGDAALITEVLPRKNYVIRRSTNLSRQAHIIAANIDRAFLVVSLYFPELKLPFLDRILVTCEVYGIPVTIVLSKTDLYREPAQEEIDRFRAIYENAGYPVIETSVQTGEGIEELRTACRDKINLFSGESGVGKSSLIKALDPSLDPKIGTISTAHLQGRHTTSLYEMYPLASGGWVIDSPGLRGFGLVDLEKEEIARYFPEMLRASAHCRFTPCTHTHEPGCAVKEAVDQGIISAERYNSYLGMLEEDKKFR